MPVLTDFLSVPSIIEENKNLSLQYIRELNKQLKVIGTFEQTNDKDNLRKEIYQKKKEVMLKLFNYTNNFLKKLETSCAEDKIKYIMKFNNILNYPFVQIQQLKEIAEALSFVILPIPYVDIYEIINLYKKADVDDDTLHTFSYSKKIKKAYDRFHTSIINCVEEDFIAPQNFYILAPLSFYDTWKEVESEMFYPKYFSSRLIGIMPIVEMMISKQRNLYKIVNMKSQNIEKMKIAMDEDFTMLKQSIEECHNYIFRVDKMRFNLNFELKKKVEYYNTEMKLEMMEPKQVKLEKMLYCFLDPIIFSVDADVDISKVEANNKLARVGLCFGPEIPVDFFVENGLQTIFDKRFKCVTEILHPHIKINAK